jgi:hypothetical protein
MGRGSIMDQHSTDDVSNKEDAKLEPIQNDHNAWPTTVDAEIASQLSHTESIEEQERQEHDPTRLQTTEKSRSILSRTVSRRSAASSWQDPGPPPDGGVAAWTQCFCTHLTIASTFGYITSFGVFQTYYQTALNVEQSTISWIGSVQLFLLFCKSAPSFA